MKTTSFSSLQSFQLSALSPLDGRYQNQIAELHTLFSEYALLKFRLSIEIDWLKIMISIVSGRTHKNNSAANRKPLSVKTQKFLADLPVKFSLDDATRIKAIEAKINHDAKAVEYFIKEKIATNGELQPYYELVHCGLTSDDINNLAYALAIKEARAKILLPALKQIIDKLRGLAHARATDAMLSRTHGQPATPTTVGKEFANFAARLQAQYEVLATAIPILGKCNGATGNYNALSAAFPEQDWQIICHKFISSLGLVPHSYTTQIEPHDYIAGICHTLAHSNTILLGLCRDVWGYIALNYFGLKTKAHEVGSSVMPHKINPIDFENAEGNLGVANALLDHLAAKLPISRWQRDLSDSTVMRNVGSSFAYCLIAYKALLQGLDKLAVNQQKLAEDLDEHWEVVAEAVQTVMRRYNIPEGYEKLKTLTRGHKITKKILHDFIVKLDLPEDAKRRLLALTPHNYLGIAEKLAKEI